MLDMNDMITAQLAANRGAATTNSEDRRGLLRPANEERHCREW
jgi:hypothetical protein